jgi:ParB-like chromosome segregation protein Spo0J
MTPKTADVETEQPKLFAVKDHANAVLSVLETASIDVPDAATLDAREVAALASNIERVGLIHQPVVMKNGKRYTVITGRRRVAAVQLLAEREQREIAEKVKAGERGLGAHLANRFAQIECYVRTERKTSAEDVAALILSENAMRSANVLGELRSINVLVDAGQTPQSIAQSTGQHISWIRHRLILNKLVKPAMTLFERGAMRFETAQRLARFDADQQKRCVAAFREKAKSDDAAVFSMSDISVGTSRPVVELPAALFAPLPRVEPTSDEPAGLDDYARELGREPADAEPLPRAIAAAEAAGRFVDAQLGDLDVAEALAALPEVAQLSIIAARLDVLTARMPDVASRDAIKRARSRVLAGREALNGGRP